MDHRLQAVKMTIPEMDRMNIATQTLPCELADMLAWFTKTRGWSLAYIQQVTQIHSGYLSKIRDHMPVPWSAAKLLWMFYYLDTAPEQLQDLFNHVTWGKIRNKPITRRARSEPAQVQHVIAHLKTLDNRNPERPTLGDVAAQFKITRALAEKCCRRASFRPRAFHRSKEFADKTIGLHDPDKIWVHVDWSRPDEEIAAETKFPIKRVQRVREQIGQLDLESIVEKFRKAGAARKNIFEFERRKLPGQLLGYQPPSRLKSAWARIG